MSDEVLYDHPDGGTYRKLHDGMSKHFDTGAWYPSVTYQDVADGCVYTVDVTRWRARYKARAA